MGDLYYAIVTQPLLNALQLLENLTHDTGIAIILIGVIINLALWPLFNKNYINQQKLKYLQPELEKIQTNLKDKPQEMLIARAEVLRKHGVSTGSFWVVLLQIPFLLSLYQIINKVTNNQEQKGIYSWIKPDGIADFSTQAFGMFNLNDIISKIGIPGVMFALAVSASSLLLGLYMFRWAPKPNLPEPPKPKNVLFKSNDPNAPDFATTLQKSIEFQSIYVFPLLYLVLNLNFPVGLVLYFLGSSVSGLIRQVAINNYYSTHGERLMKSILDSDPSLRNVATESPNIKAEPEIREDDAVATVVISKTKKVSSKKKPTKRKKR